MIPSSDDDDGIVVNTLSTDERFRRRCRPLDFRSWAMASSSFDHFVREATTTRSGLHKVESWDGFERRCRMIRTA